MRKRSYTAEINRTTISKSISQLSSKPLIACEVAATDEMTHTSSTQTRQMKRNFTTDSKFELVPRHLWLTGTTHAQMFCQIDLTSSTITDCWTCWRPHLHDCNNSHLRRRFLTPIRAWERRDQFADLCRFEYRCLLQECFYGNVIIWWAMLAPSTLGLSL